jgi:RNA polymerase nonessential primary-like sigma factor
MDKREDAPSPSSKNKKNLQNTHLLQEGKLSKKPSKTSEFNIRSKTDKFGCKPEKKSGYNEKQTHSELDPTTMYLNEIGHTPLLSANEEIRLAREIVKGNDNSRKQMIESNLRLVVTLAKRSLNRGLPLLDLIEEGNLGLMRAVEKFDPELGFRFSTYATWWIKQSIDRAIMNNGKTIRMPIHVIKEMNACARAMRQLTEELGRNPSDAELAERMQLPVKQIVKLRKREIEVCSADVPLANDADSSLLDVFPDDKDAGPEKILEKEDLRKKLEKWVERLSAREAEIVARRFGLYGYEASTLDQVGEEIGLTRERVRQIQIEALSRLRRYLEQEGLSIDYLLGDK